MMNKLILILAAITIVYSACTPTKKISTEANQIWWVSGVKTECSAGAGKMDCLNILKNEDITNANWENFYSNIEGFNFEEGFLKKIEVKIEKLDPKNVPADASSIKYTLVRELKKEVDYLATVNEKWILNRLNNNPINRSIVLPNMKINLSQKRVSGNGGCNNYSGMIKKITTNTIQFGNIISTKKACLNRNIETEYYQALNSVNTYQIKGNNLIFYNEKGKKILAYMKQPKEVNQRIHDIWIATRIDGNPINRKAIVPRLEINLTANKILGSDGCNNYTGTIKAVSDDELKFGPIAATKKMCGAMEVPDSFHRAINKVASYKLQGLNLTLLDSEGKEVLSFLKGD